MKLLKLLFCLALFALVAGAQNRRSLVFFFDFSSMSTADQVRAQDAAVSFAMKNVAPSDVVAVMTFTSELKVVQDFSPDRVVLGVTLGKIVPAPASAAIGINAVDSSLRAIQDAAKILEATPGTKQLIYFSNGVTKAGVDNQAQLEASINAAARAQVQIYPIDITGLAGQR
jgi:VWFA-related protein